MFQPPAAWKRTCGFPYTRNCKIKKIKNKKKITVAAPNRAERAPHVRRKVENLNSVFVELFLRLQQLEKYIQEIYPNKKNKKKKLLKKF